MGRASAIASLPPSGSRRGSLQPMENSPPGIHTMPTGWFWGGGAAFTTVGRKLSREEGEGCASAPPCVLQQTRLIASSRIRYAVFGRPRAALRNGIFCRRLFIQGDAETRTVREHESAGGDLLWRVD